VLCCSNFGLTNVYISKSIKPFYQLQSTSKVVIGIYKHKRWISVKDKNEGCTRKSMHLMIMQDKL